MIQEPDKNSPATLGDVDTVVGEMTTRFNAMDARFDEMREEFQEIRSDIGRLQRGLEAVLSVVTSIDEQLRVLKTLPARVERLERSRR